MDDLVTSQICYMCFLARWKWDKLSAEKNLPERHSFIIRFKLMLLFHDTGQLINGICSEVMSVDVFLTRLSLSLSEIVKV